MLPEMPKTACRCQGFTLLEIMLAMLVLAMVFTMVTLSLSSSIKAIEATRGLGDLYYRAQVAMERISEDLSASVLTSDLEFIGGGGAESGKEDSLLSFASLSHLVFDRKNGKPGLARINYVLQADETEDDSWLLLRGDELYLPKADKGKGEVELFLLCDRLRKIKFSFVARDGTESETWDTREMGSEQDQPRKLPAAVSCSLEFWWDRSAETSITFTSTVILPVGMIQPEEKK